MRCSRAVKRKYRAFSRKLVCFYALPISQTKFFTWKAGKGCSCLRTQVAEARAFIEVGSHPPVFNRMPWEPPWGGPPTVGVLNQLLNTPSNTPRLPSEIPGLTGASIPIWEVDREPLFHPRRMLHRGDSWVVFGLACRGKRKELEENA